MKTNWRNCRVFIKYSGLEADQKVLAAHQCYAMTATTALTVQNTHGVTGVHVVPAEFVGRQIDAVAGDIGVDVVKTGMGAFFLSFFPSYSRILLSH